MSPPIGPGFTTLLNLAVQQVGGGSQGQVPTPTRDRTPVLLLYYTKFFIKSQVADTSLHLNLGCFEKKGTEVIFYF